MKTRTVASVTLATSLMLTLAAAAMGHAALVSSDPPLGGTISTPYAVTATFNEELSADGSSIVIQDSTGKAVASGAVSASDDKVMEVDLPELPDGTYQAAWTAVTADDQGVTRGIFQFQVVGLASPVPPSAVAPSTPAPEPTRTAAATAPAVATPAPSASSGQNTGSGNDLVLPLAVVVIVVIAIAGYFLYRNRRSEQPE